MANLFDRHEPPARDPRNRLGVLHLVWAIPSAIVLSFPPWFLAQWGLCYSESCETDFDSAAVASLAQSGFLFLISIGIWFGILRFVPWTKSPRLRHWVAISAASGVVLVTVAFGLLWRFS
ncbi:MAG: hypothetical protein H7201_16440 [Candidatus Saccharibacteria bacterium]|nr:hypothetical protein [Microbacteriaceae bacterium]